MLEQRIRAADARPTEAELQSIAKAAYGQRLAQFCDEQRQMPHEGEAFSLSNRTFADLYQRMIDHGGHVPMTTEEEAALIQKLGAERVKNVRELSLLVDAGYQPIKGRFADGYLSDLGFKPHDGLRRMVMPLLYEAYRDACVDAEAVRLGFQPISRFAVPATVPAPLIQEASPESTSEQPGTNTSTVSDEPTFGRLCQMASDSKEADGEWVPKTARQRRSLGHLIDLLVGEIPCSRFGQAQLAEFVRKRKLITEKLSPANEKEAKRILALVKQDEVVAKDKRTGPHGKTVNRDLTAIQAVATWARAEGHQVPELNSKTLRASKRSFEVRARDERKPTSVEDLQKLYSLPVFTGCQPHNGGKGRRVLSRRFSSGPAIIHDAFYWVPLLVTYQGVRREEACKLMPGDFYFDCENPYFWVDFTETGRLKNIQSCRALAIHPELLRLGLEAYVREAEARGYLELFPDLRPTNAVETYGDQFFDLCWSHFRKRGGLDPETDIHGFRHAFGSNLKKRKVDRETRADLLGHGGETETDERYVEPAEIAAMLEEIVKLPNVTSHLVRAELNFPRPIPFRGSAKKNAAGNVGPPTP